MLSSRSKLLTDPSILVALLVGLSSSGWSQLFWLVSALLVGPSSSGWSLFFWLVPALLVCLGSFGLSQLFWFVSDLLVSVAVLVDSGVCLVSDILVGPSSSSWSPFF